MTYKNPDAAALKTPLLKFFTTFNLLLFLIFNQLLNSCANLGSPSTTHTESYDNDPNDLSAVQEEKLTSNTKDNGKKAAKNSSSNTESEQASEDLSLDNATEENTENQAKPEDFEPATLANSPIDGPTNGQTLPSEPPLDQAATENLAPPPPAANPQNATLAAPPAPPTSLTPPPPPLSAVTPPPAKGAPSTVIAEVDPSIGTLHWVGYHYQPSASLVRIEMVTKGHPRYDLFQEKNKGQQPEIIIRFLNTSLRPKIRRDIDASEFNSPVAYIRMRPSPEQQHVDVIVTLRDQVKPKIFAKNGNVMLTFAIPDHYFGPSALGGSPIARASFLPGKDLFPEIIPGSDTPQSYSIEKQIPTDPGTQAFQGIPETAAQPVEPSPAPQNTPVDKDGLPPSFEPAPANNGAPVNSSLPVANNIPAAENASSNSENPDFNQEGSNGANGQNTQSNQSKASGGSNENEFNDSGTDEEAPLDDDSLKDFDDGDGDSGNTIEKFDVNLKIAPIPWAQVKVTPWSAMAVAQEDFGANDGSGSTPGNTPGNIPNNPPVNAPSNGGAGNATPVETIDIPPEPEAAPLPLATPPTNGASANAATVGLAEPPLGGSPDLTGQEQMGAESAVPPTLSGGGKPIKMDFRGAPLSEVMRVLTEESGTNFVLPLEVGSRMVNVSLNNVPFNDALKAILDSQNLGMVVLAPQLVRVDSSDNITKAAEEAEKRRKAEIKLAPTKILVYRLNYSRAPEAAKVLGEMLAAAAVEDPRIKVQTDDRSNSVIVNAPVTELNMIKALLQRIDLETPQVKISSRIVEVFKSAADSLGISWGGPFNLDQGRGLGFGNLVFPNSVLSRYSVDNGGLADKSVNFRSRIGSINNSMAFDLALSMEESMGTGEVLQSGNLIVEDNQKAEIIAGQSDFFRVTLANGAGDLREVQYNLTMTVTPHITADGAVQMNITIDSDTPRASSGGDAVAARNNRTITTTLLRRSGETAVIGGIYNTTHNKAQSGVPFLSSLPILGALFRSRSETDEKRELLVMVTPTIVNIGKNSQTTGVASAGGPSEANMSATESSNTPANSGLDANNSANGGETGGATFSNSNFGTNNTNSSTNNQGSNQQSSNGTQGTNDSGQQNEGGNSEE